MGFKLFFCPFRFLQVLKGCDELMNYISDDKLLEMVTEDNDKELVKIVQTKLEVMQGVSFVSRHVDDTDDTDVDNNGYTNDTADDYNDEVCCCKVS